MVSATGQRLWKIMRAGPRVRRWGLVCGMILIVSLPALAWGRQKKEAKALFDRAKAAYDLTAQGSEPFVLKASWSRGASEGPSLKGTLTFYWASPDHWRKDVVTGKSERILVRAGDREARLTKGPWTARECAVWDGLVQDIDLKKFFEWPEGSHARLSERVGKNGRQFVLLIVLKGSGGEVGRLRLDPRTGEVLGVPGEPWNSVTIESKQAEGKFLATRIGRYSGKALDSMWSLDEYSPQKSGQMSPLSFPVGGKVWTVCGAQNTHPRLKRRVIPEYPYDLQISGRGGMVVIETEISRKGKVIDTCVVRSSSKALSHAARAAIRRWKFEIPPCLAPQAPFSIPITIRFLAG